MTSIVAVMIASLIRAAQSNDGGLKDCNRIDRLVEIAKAPDARSLRASQARAPRGYDTELTYAATAATLRPRDAIAASLLLNRLPQTDSQREISLGLTTRCPGLGARNAFALSGVVSKLGQLAANASLISTREMPTYLRFAIGLRGLVDNDVPEKMQRVCRSNRKAFQLAVRSLQVGERQELDAHVIDIRTCRAKILPEAD